MPRRKRTHFWAGVGQLVISLAALGVISVEYLVAKPPESLRDILMPILFLFATMIVVDKFGAVFSGRSFDEERQEVTDLVQTLPSLMSKSHDVVTFSSRARGYTYCINAAEFAISVKNTVIRYGDDAAASPNDYDYAAWREAKYKSITTSHCEWYEIVSNYLARDNPQISLFDKTKLRRTNYHSRYIDDVKCPMVQMTIFDFHEYREVIFGWEFPELEQGMCFLTRNDRVVAYFDKYFMHHYDKIAVEHYDHMERSASTQPIAPNAALETRRR